MHISVENPCHEDWQKMTPETQGRFCGACEKTVVDFSEMSDAEILLYFSKPKTEKVCGRFRPEQLSPSGESATPRFVESIVSQKMPNYPVQPSKQLLHFAYLLVMVLGIGVSACGDVGIKGKVKGQVQLINVYDAYPSSYKTYGNRDFGTVKGTTISYDMRRTGNIRMTAAYTLQFANGTGSDENSSTGLINAGLPNLRATFPFNYDQRHAFAITMDYRYGEGKDYNGPVVKNFNVFENTGLNLISNIYSGSPYSAQNFITNEGSFNPGNAGLSGTTNGSRLPWSYRLDLQLDRTFNVTLGKSEDKKKVTFLNVYIRVTNVLNQKNRINVYRATGNWDDDGYLAAAASQTSIQNQLDEQSFRDFYTMKIQNATNISAPRTIRLGVKFDF